MSMFEAVNPDFLPRPFHVRLNAKDIAKVEKELVGKAQNDPHKCRAYFARLDDLDSSAIDTHLPKSKKFAKKYPSFTLDGKDWQFSFVRLSLVSQPAMGGLHTDKNASTGLSNDNASMQPTVRAWRAILNLGLNERVINFSHQEPLAANPQLVLGRLVYSPHPVSLDEIAIPARIDDRVSGAAFCVSHVLHGGADSLAGHFIATYGNEEPL